MNKKYITSQKNRLSLALLLSIGLSSCGGGGGSASPPEVPITSFELLDPTPGASEQFGREVTILTNGNIVVTDRHDSSISTNNGAVHLYDPRSQTLIASIYGDNADDFFGTRITALANNNFVIASWKDDVAGIIDAGSVRLVNGSTGVQIGAAIVGDNVGDQFGLADQFGLGGIIALENNNFVIVSEKDDFEGISKAGSVRLVNGSTGAQIGDAIVGDDADDLILVRITALENNNFVIASGFDDIAGIANAGSVRLVNGSTGEQIGAAIVGDDTDDQIGHRGITALANNNFVIASTSDDVAGITNAGSVWLVNGSTGAQIGTTIVGDSPNPSNQFGRNIIALANNNFVIASYYDEVAGITRAGSVRLVNGSTGAQIGAAIVGDNPNDQFGEGITALANNNFVIASQNDDVPGITDAGSVRLVNGSTGEQIGAAIVGDDANDNIGNRGITALANNNFVIGSTSDDVAGVKNAGSVRLVNGSTGVQIGTSIVGDDAFDNIGTTIIALANNNFVAISLNDDVAGITNAGSVRLVNGSTGAQIGDAIVGDDADDLVGIRVTGLANNNFVIASRLDDVEGITDAGSIRLVDGNTGTQIGDLIVGSVEGDMTSMSITVPTNENFYIMALPAADNNGSVDSGLVRLIAP